ncbi:hypothetical protein ACH5RR_029738 [Cinchona calisaya]|uniref:Retrotransposon gag domain-containing protein n=1 Tax=Cinchona calisaya TaxID=153742 RepID=A0ABD2YVU4_9GENT
MDECFVAMSKVGIPTLEEGVDPGMTNKWCGLIEEILALLKTHEPLKPQIAIHFLIGEVSAWWKGLPLALTLNGPVTWDRFHQAFLKNYFPPILIAQKRREFMMLKQKPGIFVVEYSH